MLSLYPMEISGLAWDLWFVSWVVAALWSARTAKRAPSAAQNRHWVPTIIGFVLLIAAADTFDERGQYFGSWPFWTLNRTPAAWITTALVLLGLGFTWWARIHLGRLWSNSVTRKEGHRVVDSGPYGLVRHPIYTGLILAAFAFAVQVGTIMAFAGAGFITLGFWIKARLEERFLREELGSADYDAYAGRTPMLVPFWPNFR
jgi:protein-S-isoprenylcysteine O-methyltransferase Ste14